MVNGPRTNLAVAVLTRVAAVTVASGMLGCGAAAAFDGRSYRAEGVSFHVGEAPASWQRSTRVEGPLVAYEDPAHHGVVSVYARCGRDGDDVPLTALTQHLLIGFTEREIAKQEVEPFDGREALHTVASGKLDGVAVGLDMFVLKKDGCVYDLVYAAPPASIDGGMAGFESFARGFGSGSR
jgi:hypothetical protein